MSVSYNNCSLASILETGNAPNSIFRLAEQLQKPWKYSPSLNKAIISQNHSLTGHGYIISPQHVTTIGMGQFVTCVRKSLENLLESMGSTSIKHSH
jgi:hypothetical protein